MKKHLVFGLLATLLMVFAFGSQAMASTNSVSIKDAEKQGQILATMVSDFNKMINRGDIHEIDVNYDEVSAQIRKTERAIGRVQGATKRKNLNQKYVNVAKVARERVIYEVSQIRLMEKIEELIYNRERSLAESELAKLKRLNRRAEEIKRAGGYAPVPASITSTLVEYEQIIRTALLEETAVSFLDLLFEDINTGNVEGISGKIHSASPNAAELKKALEDLANSEYVTDWTYIEFTLSEPTAVVFDATQEFWLTDPETFVQEQIVEYELKKENGQWKVFNYIVK